ncbi:thioredoxin reductase (NADPH) [Saprolegnia diclina VS20]|uniref:Thioredoxin reductase (NADPH) n=1 Tax=Saprolegnia diclina (strain VS20) TaxID=1156394 RepID=T0QU98_SAPDV|nr:thioredoxin reductase (NADPH) [Saprolegnia diclina VS20]EQC37575.1 thioredoxin reductase (NADPH) [Saprolegnia diclina VS20]|eukprot:XP_008609095.1 thioredoxin reductase (NADPH) [Saprolegnia diclina VS20]
MMHSIALSRKVVAAACRRMHMEASSSDVTKSAVKELIGASQVVLFSKSYCQFSERVKELFDDMDIQSLTIDLDDLDEGAHIQDALRDMTQQCTIPNVFINGKHIGGCESVMKLVKANKLMDTISGDEPAHHG